MGGSGSFASRSRRLQQQAPRPSAKAGSPRGVRGHALMISKRRGTKRAMFGWPRVLIAVAVFMVLGGGSLAAQERKTFPVTLDAYGSVDGVSLYEGDRFFGAGFTWGFTGSLAFRSGSPLGGEIFMAFTPSDDGRDVPTPRISLSGAWATLQPPQRPEKVMGPLRCGWIGLSGYHWVAILSRMYPGWMRLYGMARHRG